MKSVEVKHLTRRFRLKGGEKLAAVDDISFSVEEGEIFGFLGPNGAGKSTTINILATIDKPTAGDAFVNHFSVSKDRDEVRKSIGIVFQDSSLDDRLTACENLKFHAMLYGVPKADYGKRMPEVLKLVDLYSRRNTIVKNFSGGMKRRLEIARGLLHYPSVLFLDEPTTGLDPQTRKLLWEYLYEIKKERDMTVMMTTHYLEEAENCDRIAIIDHGRIIALGTPERLKKEVGGQERRVVVGPTLDDVFIRLTGREIRDEEASDHEKMASGMRGRGRGGR